MRTFLAVLMLALAGAAFAQSSEIAKPDPVVEERLKGLAAELRCLVCQNQTIADSNADLATDLREQVHQRIAAGQSDDQIRRYVTDRYGDFVLYKPPMSARTVLLWVGPFVLLLGALLFAVRFVRRRQTLPVAATADPDRLRRLLDEER